MNLKSQLIDFFSNLSDVQNNQQRSAFIAYFRLEHLRRKIDWEGNTLIFFAGLISLLAAEGRDPLLNFLRTFTNSDWIGIEGKQKVTELHTAIAVLNNERWRQEFAISSQQTTLPKVMDDRESLERTLNRARRALKNLEQEKANHGIRVPVDLQIDLEEKQKQVASLEARLSQLHGNPPPSVPNNLPRSDIFVGRIKDIARCLEALAADERGWGVVIDGIGGMGKTALALEVAHITRNKACFDAYLFASAKTTSLSPEGVREETLALSSLDAFCREFARLLGQEDILQIRDATERRRALLDALQGRRVLLIWDNLETLTAEEREMIAEFLRKLPTPNKAIVTSRRRVGESAVTIRLDSLSESEAFDLMTEVGRRHPRVAAELTFAGVTARRDLYEAAGGNPLALNWTLGMVAHKGNSLAVAIEQMRDAARSPDLYGFLFTDAVRSLVKTDRTVLSALSAFHSPATANALVDATDLAETEVSIALERLVTLSLVNDLDGGRYCLHPLTRTYVHAELGAGDEVMRAPLDGVTLDPAAQRQVLRYWVDYAQKYGGNSKNYKTFDRLEAEWQNLEGSATLLRDLAGVPGKLKDQEAARMLNDLASALCNLLWIRGYWDERVRLSEWAYQADIALGDWSQAGWRAYDVAWIYCTRAETDKATTWADRMAEAMERGGNRRDKAYTSRLRGLIAEQQSDLPEAERLSQEALAAFRDLGDDDDVATALSYLGTLAKIRREYDRAESYYHQAMTIAEKQRNQVDQAYYSLNLGFLALRLNRPAEARSWYDLGLTLAQQVGQKFLIANAQAGLAHVLEREQRYAEALDLAREALQIR